jgi:hypothetical protein
MLVPDTLVAEVRCGHDLAQEGREALACNQRDPEPESGKDVIGRLSVRVELPH